MRLSLYVFLCCLISPCLAQNDARKADWFADVIQPKPTPNLVQQYELQKCQKQLQDWQAWGAENVPRYDEMKREYDQLKKEKVFGAYTAAIVIAILAVGIGLGIGLLNKFVRLWRRLAPSKAKKQLTVMIACSIWLTVAATVLASDSNLSKHPINLLVSVFIYSLPAILFGCIALWWFSRSSTATAS